MFDIYLIGQDDGVLKCIVRNVSAENYKLMADDYHFEDKFDVKVVNKEDDAVVYTLMTEL